MSHFAVMVILPEGTTPNTAEVAADKLMAPYQEGDEWFADGSRWDWYMVGGRWDGAIRGLPWQTYEETCSLCGGTGVRPGGLEEFGQEWYDWSKGCNGCMGTGRSAAWPTDDRYSDLARNLTMVADVPHDYIPKAFVTPDGTWHEKARMGWWGKTIEDEAGRSDKVAPFDQELAAAREAYARHLAVGLDCHI